MKIKAKIKVEYELVLEKEKIDIDDMLDELDMTVAGIVDVPLKEYKDYDKNGMTKKLSVAKNTEYEVTINRAQSIY